MSLLDTLSYLGDTANDMTEQQIRLLEVCAAQVGQRYPDDDEARRMALEAALAIIRGKTQLDALSNGWRTSKRLERAQMAMLTGAVIAAVNGGESELAVSVRTGLNRATVRRALGK
jgi:hypothetical protein